MNKSEKTFGALPRTGVPTFIGIDQSYTGFGMTVLNKTGYQTTVTKFEGSGVYRLAQIRHSLNTRFTELGDRYEGITDVAIEAPVRQSHSALMSGELFAVVRLALADCLDVYPLQVPPTTLKKYVTGKGTGVQKNQMLLKVYQKWGVEFDDDNAADSYGLARIASKIADTSYEKEVVTKLTGDPKHRDIDPTLWRRLK